MIQHEGLSRNTRKRIINAEPAVKHTTGFFLHEDANINYAWNITSSACANSLPKFKFRTERIGNNAEFLGIATGAIDEMPPVDDH